MEQAPHVRTNFYHYVFILCKIQFFMLFIYYLYMVKVCKFLLI